MAPRSPVAERRELLLGVLADLVARGGALPLLAPPVVPGVDAFPEPWRATRGGVRALLRRLAWHAGNPRTIELGDERLGAPPTERKPETRVGLTMVRAKQLQFRVEFLGEDDVAGTLAHELGVAHAAVNRPESVDPYRSGEQPEIEIDVERDHERGSIATVYLGLGVIAANAAFQEYSRPGRFNGGYSPLEYDVLRAGYLPMSELAYLLAVQAAVCGTGVPDGLGGPQRDEVSAWLSVLAPQRTELRERLGIPPDAEAVPHREKPERFADIDLAEDAPPPRKTAFRWRTHRGGVGFVAGAVLGVGVAVAVATPSLTPLLIFGAAGGGHVVGRRVRVPRCTACASVVEVSATTCRACGAALRGDIAQLSDRLEAEERLEAEAHAERPTDLPDQSDQRAMTSAPMPSRPRRRRN
ncbi:MAG: hypothetical protein IPQ07_04985 [Myxococcales bacterium]|nr:hypothetical protein [Myxococcales bacterium]